MISTSKCHYIIANPACLAVSANMRKFGTRNKCKQSSPKVGSECLGQKNIKPSKTQSEPSIQKALDNYLLKDATMGYVSVQTVCSELRADL